MTCQVHAQHVACSHVGVYLLPVLPVGEPCVVIAGLASNPGKV